jgi:hypothetical protein
MVTQIAWAVERTGEPYFRWFDSGDLPAGQTGMHMLSCIVSIARRMKGVSFWLPTRELATVKACLSPPGPDDDVAPGNLVVRLSSAMVGAAPLHTWHRRSARGC